MLALLNRVHDHLKGWRTVAFNGLVIAGAVVAYLANSSAVPAKYVLAVGVTNIVLRYVTTTPMGVKP